MAEILTALLGSGGGSALSGLASGGGGVGSLLGMLGGGGPGGASGGGAPAALLDLGSGTRHPGTFNPATGGFSYGLRYDPSTGAYPGMAGLAPLMPKQGGK